MFIRHPVRSTTASVARISRVVLLERVGVLVKTNMILELPNPPMMPMAKRITPVTILAVGVGCSRFGMTFELVLEFADTFPTIF